MTKAKKDKYIVVYNDAERIAYIMNDGSELAEGYEELGSFSLDPGDGLSINGEHIFIVKARELLSEADIGDLDSIVIEDKASNEPDPDERIPSTKEVVEENKDRIEGNETGTKDEKKKSNTK